MSISYGIIKRHGGEIDVESEVGRGTTITIRLPINKNNNDFVTIFEQMHTLEVTNLRIMVVDDEQAVCEFLSEFLSQEGQNVKSVYGGKEAIKLLKSESFDLVLCDLVMPEIGGREVIKMLDTLNKRPKVGLITGWSEELETFSKEDWKVDFIVKKPFHFSELSKQINNVFSVTSGNS
jgi:CheY-like chemotaxis protein